MSYAKTVEEQVTERERIKSETAKTLENIKSMREVLLTDINRNYENRAYLYLKYFEKLDKFIENNQPELALQVLDNIKNLASSSPLNEFIEMRRQTSQMLLDNKDINL